MPKATTFTIEIDPELLAEFMAAAEAADRPATEVVCQLIREWIDRQRSQRDAAAFLPAGPTTVPAPSSMPKPEEP